MLLGAKFKLPNYVESFFAQAAMPTTKMRLTMIVGTKCNNIHHSIGPFVS